MFPFDQPTHPRLPQMRRALACSVVLLLAAAVAVSTAGAAPGADVRLTNDDPTLPGAGYESNYTMVTGTPYTDGTLDECSESRGRENEPTVAIDPRNTEVMV